MILICILCFAAGWLSMSVVNYFSDKLKKEEEFIDSQLNKMVKLAKEAGRLEERKANENKI